MNYLKLDNQEIEDTLSGILEMYDSHAGRVNSKLLPDYSPSDLQGFLKNFDFEAGNSNAIIQTIDEMDKGILNLHGPGYLGVFNPAPTPIGAIANFASSLYNPQLASTISAPFPILVEEFLIKYFAKRAGYSELNTEGHFTTGGTEANITAVVSALNLKFPSLKIKGLMALKANPKIYISEETHNSLQRAAMVSGLGSDALVKISVDTNGKLSIDELQKKVQSDIEAGHTPFMVVGTLGTTSSGTIDNLEAIAKIAKEFEMWFHVDAAYGGASLLLDDHLQITRGIEFSDSFTLDAHKWLALPFGASMFITQKKGITRSTFETSDNVYMPNSTEIGQGHEPYRDSMQWSRRFMGLGLFLALSYFGRKEYSEKFMDQILKANSLREELIKSGFEILNDSPLPVICFSHPDLIEENVSDFRNKFIAHNPEFYISDTYLKGTKRTVLRAGINNNLTNEETILSFVNTLKKELNNYN